jgi:hypothetical protein
MDPRRHLATVEGCCGVWLSQCSPAVVGTLVVGAKTLGYYGLHEGIAASYGSSSRMDADSKLPQNSWEDSLFFGMFLGDPQIKTPKNRFYSNKNRPFRTSNPQIDRTEFFYHHFPRGVANYLFGGLPTMLFSSANRGWFSSLRPEPFKAGRLPAPLTSTYAWGWGKWRLRPW